MSGRLPTRPCDKCGRPVVWTVTELGRKLPVDPTADTSGTVFVRYERGRLMSVSKSEKNPRPRGVAFIVHYATCPAIQRTRTERTNPK